MSAQSHQFRNFQASDTLNHHFASIPASEKETHQNLWRQEMEDNLAENGNDSDDDGDNFDNSGEENEENSNEYNSSGRNRLLMDGNDLLEIARNFSKKVSQNDNEEHSDHSNQDRNERNDHPDSKDSRYSYGRWTSHEHALFLEGIQMFDNKWQLISNHIKTRNTIQVRTHAQKFYLKMNKQMHHMTGHTGSISVPPQFTEMKQYKQTTRVNQTPAQTAHFPLPRQKQPNYDEKRENNLPMPSKTSQSNSSSSKLPPGIPSQPSTATPAHPSTAVGLTLPQDLLQNYIANIDAQIQQNKQEKFAAYAASNRDKSFNDSSSKVNRKPPTNVGPYYQQSQQLQQQHQLQQQYMDKFPPFLQPQIAQNGVNYSQQPQGMLGVSGTNYTYWQPPAPQNNQFNTNVAHNNPNISNSNNFNGLNFSQNMNSQNNIHFPGQNINNSNSNSGNYVSNNDPTAMNSNKNNWSSMYSTMDNHSINFNNNQFSFPTSDPKMHNNSKQMENYIPMQQYGPPFPYANQSNSQSLLPFVPATSNTSNTSTNTTSSGINSFPNNMLTMPFDGMNNNSVVAQPLPPITAAMMLPGIPASQSTQSTQSSQFTQSQSAGQESGAEITGLLEQTVDNNKPTAPWASVAPSDNNVNTSASSAPLSASQPMTASQDSISPPKVIHFQHGLTLVSSENETASSDAPLLTSLGKLSENKTDLLSSSVALLSKTALSPQAHNTRLSGLMFPLSDGNHAQEQQHQQVSQNLFSPPAPVEVQYTTEEIKAMQSIGGVNGLINTMRIQQMHLNGGNLNGSNSHSSNGALLSQLQLQQPPPQPAQPKKRGRPTLYNTSQQAQPSSLEAQQREKLAKLTPLTGFVGVPMPEDSFVRVPSIELPVPQVPLVCSSEFNESLPPSQQHQAQLMQQQALQIAAKQQVDQMNAALQQLQQQQSTQHFFADHQPQQEPKSSLIAPTPLPLPSQSASQHFEQDGSDSDQQKLRQQQQYPEQQLNFDIAQQLAQLQAHLENVNKPQRGSSAARAGATALNTTAVSGSEFSNHPMAQLHEAIRSQPEQSQRHQKMESDISGILSAFAAAKNSTNDSSTSGGSSPIPPLKLQNNNANHKNTAGFGKEVRSGYRHLNLAQKYEVVQKMKQFEASPVKVKGTQGLLAIEFNVCQSSIYQILKKRDEIEKEYLAELHRQNNDCSFPPAEQNYGYGYNAKQLGYDHMVGGPESGLFNNSSINNSSNSNSGPTQDSYASGQTTQEQLSQMSWQQQLLSQEEDMQQYGEEYGEEYGDDNGDNGDNSDNGAMDTQESSGSGQPINSSNSRSSNNNRNSGINNNITGDNKNNDNRNNKHGFNQYYTSDQHAALDEVPKPGSIGAAALSAHSVELFVDTTAVIPAIPMSRYLQEEPESPVKRVPLRTSQSAATVSREQRQRKPSAKVKENYNSTSASTAASSTTAPTYSTARLAEYYTMMAKFELIVAEQLNVYNIQTVTDAHKYVEWYAQYYELTELNGDPWHYTPEWFATFNEQYMEGRFVIDYY